jgi:photosystem II stability/assembly factor-like uncharacterized protein
VILFNFRNGRAALSAVALALGLAVAPVVAQTQRAALQAPLATMAPLMAVSHTGNAFVAVGDYGVILTSAEGRDWRQAKVPVDGPLTDVHFIDAQQGWAVGHGGVVLHSRDGGQAWQLLSRIEGAPVLLALWFENAMHGLAVGAYGAAWVTHDGGISWQQTKIGEGRDGDLHLNAIIVDKDGRLFIAGESGAIFRSSDKGASWSRLKSGVTGSLWGGVALRDGGLVIFGMSGRILTSQDHGATWQNIDSGTREALTGGTELADGRLVVVGNGGLVTLAKGRPLAFTATVRSDRQNLSSVAAGPLGLLLVGQQGVVKNQGTP